VRGRPSRVRRQWHWTPPGASPVGRRQTVQPDQAAQFPRACRATSAGMLLIRSAVSPAAGCDCASPNSRPEMRSPTTLQNTNPCHQLLLFSRAAEI